MLSGQDLQSGVQKNTVGRKQGNVKDKEMRCRKGKQ